MRGFLAVVAFFLASFVTASPARAAFGDCTTVEYIASFPENHPLSGINCIELFRIDYDTPTGPRSIRAITDVVSDWAVTPAMISGVQRGAQASIDSFASLGTYTIADVTILLMDGMAITDAGEILAATMSDADECLINQFALVSVSSEIDMAVTTAHEIFHCVQFATVSQAQMDSYGENGAWWIEGTAEYFASLALADSGETTNRGAAFSDAVRAGTPLYEMEHIAVVFFDWYLATTGTEHIVPFMLSMASDGSAAAQRTAMRAALTDDQWLGFAKAYAEQTIIQPHGGAVSVTAEPATTLDVIETQDMTVTAQPFAIYLANVNYDCGTWSNRLTPDPVNLALRVAFSTDWGLWPPEIDTRDAAASSYDFAVMHTGDDALDLTVAVEQIRTCQPCADVDTVDMCVGGTWELTSGGAIAWMQAQGLPITNVRADPRVMTFLDSGAFVTAPFSVTYDMNADDFAAAAQANADAMTGRWSVSDGQLNICPDAGGYSGQARISVRDGSYTIPVSEPAGRTISMAYTCADGALNTTISIRGAPPMETGYTKTSE